MHEPKTFGVDYDGTWSSDPDAFEAIAALLISRGHRVVVVTARASGHVQVRRAVGSCVHRVIFTSGRPKRAYCAMQDEHIDIWIDDMPEMIVSSTKIIG